jgi:hypothetical protein
VDAIESRWLLAAGLVALAALADLVGMALALTEKASEESTDDRDGRGNDTRAEGAGRLGHARR